MEPTASAASTTAINPHPQSQSPSHSQSRLPSSQPITQQQQQQQQQQQLNGVAVLQPMAQQQQITTTTTSVVVDTAPVDPSRVSGAVGNANVNVNVSVNVNLNGGVSGNNNNNGLNGNSSGISMSASGGTGVGSGDNLKIHVQLPNGVIPTPMPKAELAQGEALLQRNMTRVGITQDQKTPEAFLQALKQVGPQQSLPVGIILPQQVPKPQPVAQEHQQGIQTPQSLAQSQQQLLLLQQQQLQQFQQLTAQRHAQQQQLLQSRQGQLPPLQTPPAVQPQQPNSFQSFQLQLQAQLQQAQQVQQQAQLMQQPQTQTLPQTQTQLPQGSSLPNQQAFQGQLPQQKIPPQNTPPSPQSTTSNTSQAQTALQQIVSSTSPQSNQAQLANLQKLFQSLPQSTQQQIHMKLCTAKIQQIQQSLQQLQSAHPSSQQQQETTILIQQQQFLHSQLSSLQQLLAKGESSQKAGSVGSPVDLLGQIKRDLPIGPPSAGSQQPMAFQQQLQQHLTQQVNVQNTPQKVLQGPQVQMAVNNRPMRTRRQSLKAKEAMDLAEFDEDDDEDEDKTTYSLRKRRRVAYKDAEEGAAASVIPKKGRGKKAASTTVEAPVSTPENGVTSSNPTSLPDMINATGLTTTTSSVAPHSPTYSSIAPSSSPAPTSPLLNETKEATPPAVEAALDFPAFTAPEKKDEDRDVIEKIIAHVVEYKTEAKAKEVVPAKENKAKEVVSKATTVSDSVMKNEVPIVATTKTTEEKTTGDVKVETTTGEINVVTKEEEVSGGTEKLPLTTTVAEPANEPPQERDSKVKSEQPEPPDEKRPTTAENHETKSETSATSGSIPVNSAAAITPNVVTVTPAPTQPVVKYLVKWRDKSYVHCEWITEPQLLQQEGKQGAAKIKRYWTKRGNEQHPAAGASEDPCAEEFFPPEYIQVDRIIASGEVDLEEGKKPMYLVKWVGLSYTESTWEFAEDFKDDKKIEDYRRFHILPREPPPAPLPSRLWVKMEQTPEYKGSNMLRPYQLEGLNWLIFCWCQGRGSILADEMGLGKTVQVVAFFEHLRVVQLLPGPFLVVAPLTTIAHWVKELQEWTDMNVVVYIGNKDNREYIKKYEWFYLDQSGRPLSKQIKFTVLVTTYEMVMTDANDLARIQWQVIVVDEAHRMKNSQSKLITTLKTIKGYHRILLTGTPIQNNTKELWSLLNFIEPVHFASQDDFLDQFENLQDEGQVKKLQDVLHPHLLRRMKGDVEKSIPPKEETVVEVELTVLQKQYYRAILEKNREFLNKGCANNANVPNLLNIVMQLRKVCNHPFLIPGVEEKEAGFTKTAEDYNTVLTRSSGKLVLLDKLLPKLFAAHHKILIFSQLKGVLDLLEKYLQFNNYLYERLDGGVKANDRQMSIERFCNPEYRRFVFLLSTRAGGFGINLAAADTVVIYDSDWNPQNDVQAQARCHRIGQQKDVKVYRLLSRNTYEMIMFDRASKKLGLDQVVLHSIGSNNNNHATVSSTGTGTAKQSAATSSGLSKEEINDMLRYGAYDLFREGEADQASASFCEDDIENILVKRSSRVVWKEDNQGSMFSKATFHLDEQTASLDVKDPHFWEKVLPQAATAKSLLDQITNLVAGKSESEQRVWLESKKEGFLHSLQGLVEAMITGYNEAKGRIPPDRDNLRNLLLFCASHTTTLFVEEQAKILEWLSDIDFSRRKRKVYKVDSAQQSQHLSDDDSDPRNKKKSKKHPMSSSPPPQALRSNTKSKRSANPTLPPTVSKKPTCDILSLDWLSSNQPRALFEAFLLYCRPCWKLIQSRSVGFSHHAHHELSDIVCTFLQQCILIALPSDKQIFKTVLDRLNALKTSDRFSRTKSRRKRPDEDSPISSIGQDEISTKLSEIADRMRLLEQLNNEISTASTPNNYTVLDFGRRLTPWWDVTRDRDLLLGTFKHGWGCYPAICADYELCFTKDIQQYGDDANSPDATKWSTTSSSKSSSTIKVRIGAKKLSSTPNKSAAASWPSDDTLHEHIKFLLDCIRKNKDLQTAPNSRRKRHSASASATAASTAASMAGSSITWHEHGAVRTSARRRHPKVDVYGSDSQSGSDNQGPAAAEDDYNFSGSESSGSLSPASDESPNIRNRGHAPGNNHGRQLATTPPKHTTSTTTTTTTRGHALPPQSSKSRSGRRPTPKTASSTLAPNSPVGCAPPPPPSNLSSAQNEFKTNTTSTSAAASPPSGADSNPSSPSS
ncbi:chromodomain helicase DNA binding protein [Pelomyxa schiedti]|nr:chromodomain helicase DNA binding protein [Pelomyxa schiedti]